MQFTGKLMNQAWEIGEKLNFTHDFGPFGPKFFSWFLPLLGLRYCRKLSLSYAISRKIYDLNSRKCQKTWLWAWFRPVRPKFDRHFFFVSNIWLRQSLDIMVIYHHVQYQKKLMMQSCENLVTDERTDRQTDESDFIGRCPSH